MSTRACSKDVAEASPPSHCGVLAAGKKTAPQTSLVKKKAEFSHTLWPKVHVPTEALTPLSGGAGVTAGAVALQCNSAVAEHMSPILGQWVGGGTKKK